MSARRCGLEDCGVEAGEFPGNGKNSRFGYSRRNPNYRTYRRGRENEPGGIGTVTIRCPSVAVRSSLPEARTSLKGCRTAIAEKRVEAGHGNESGEELIQILSTRVLSRRFA